MLLEQRTQDRIDRAIDIGFISFLISLVGYEILSDDEKRRAAEYGLVQITAPLLDSLYNIARKRSFEENRKPAKLRDLIAMAGLMGTMPMNSDTQVYTLEHAKREMYDSVLNARDEFKRKIRQQALKINDQARLNSLSLTATSSERQERKEKQVDSFLSAIGTIALALSFTRGATVALTNMVNNAAVDEAQTHGTFHNGPFTESRVYKRVMNDGRLCGWCSSFYMNKDGSPKVYRLADLAANGSNDGKPKSQWKATIGSTHARCRCQLHFLSVGQELPR